MHHAWYYRFHLCVCLPCITLWVLWPKDFRFFSRSAMCCPMPVAPGCSFPTRPCTSLFGMTNRWWPYSTCFWGTYGVYPAGGCHPPWYLLIGPTGWYPAAAVAPLPSHCLGTYTFINGLLHASFNPCDPVWCPEAVHFPDPCILLVLILVKAYFRSARSYRLVLPKKCAPDNPPPHFPPDRSFLVT